MPVVFAFVRRDGDGSTILYGLETKAAPAGKRECFRQLELMPLSERESFVAYEVGFVEPL